MLCKNKIFLQKNKPSATDDRLVNSSDQAMDNQVSANTFISKKSSEVK